ncbi:uncharacterized protein LAESUDRAFT_748568 [Laetiporus sulphureus 93-53]|uniref:F-box domain-containing protein n=1 Tax=Laetiporus sulphureus 93-53 TaxID=1314785 RepID=A0A165FGP4_9APHY|nr:uncharacterized protein LAESUDRAFT_748568 [Laetiporus sulphureus 93-53]KZT08942.1 hypothetical protein LAESUDRAFT_748568 [Laetiporus sulphureus 93-53]
MLSLSHNNKSSLGPALLLPSGGIDEETIAMLVGSMLKVSSLSLKCRIPPQCSTWPVTRFRSPLLRLQAVTHFSAHDVYFTNLGQFQYVICQWPQLRTLTLYKVAFRTFDSYDVDIGKLQLRSLELSNMQQQRTLDYVLALFAKALSSRSIQTLRIWEEALFGEETEHAIDDLLRTLGSSLRRFDFPWKYDLFKKPRTDFWTPQLQHSTGLQYLCINCSRMWVLFEDLANMLSRMMLPELRAIHLVFDAYCSEQSARVLDLPYIEEEIGRWRAVEDNLQQHSPTLQEFVIWRTVHQASWRSFADERYSAAWVQVLPRLHARGILHINVRPTNPIPGPFDNVPARMQS